MDKNGIYFLALNHIAKHTSSDKPLKKALTAIAKRTSQAMKANGCSILLLNPKKDYLYILAAFGLSDRYLHKGVLDVYKSIPDIMRGEITTARVSSGDNNTQYPEAAELENISTIIGLPLFQDEEIIGELRFIPLMIVKSQPSTRNFYRRSLILSC
jgi:hypoxanthine phosphoribosyltransferase